MATIKTVLGSHYSPILGKNGKPQIMLPASWNGLEIIKSTIPEKAEFGPQYTGVPMLAFGLSGQGIWSFRVDRKTITLKNSPPQFNTYSRSYERGAGFSKGEAGSVLGLRLPPAFIKRYLPEQEGIFDLETRYGCQDKHLRTLVLSLAGEFESGMFNGPMYVEGLSMAILGWLNKHYAIKTNPVKEPQKMNPKLQTRIVEFIEEFLSSELTIGGMAAELDYSVSYFCEIFRATFGVSPHKFVIQRRVERAAQILRSQPDKSIADIAISTGFSSQAHFTYAFKQYMQQTPARYRSS